jgi:hypothetical protein
VRVFDSRVKRRKFRCKRDEMIGRWNKLRNDGSITYFFAIYYKNVYVKDDETGSVCRLHGRNEECVQKFRRRAGRIETAKNT